ncbi:multidrug ABC transporter permease [Vallitalea longa]|uniref:Multidrug ABC transporter permease n=1 Tax=Vallitalea longa TaxID=2936439 RepID=A0A9W6DDQ5_9FIRM|nr:ABC transporter permease [Vallitalea longa]GKX28590.1 multidrug ABC transporter permease [Vallitalea longa]
MKILILEYMKLRRKKIFLMITLFISVEIAWALMSVSIALSRNPSNSSWMSTMVTLSSMNGLFLPIISAVVMSRICDMEHKGNTWKLLMSVDINPRKVYGAKYLCGNFLLLYAVVLQAIAIIIFNILKGLSEPILFTMVLRFILGTSLANMAVLALQQWISLSIKNQSFALCIGMIGGFLGMTGDFFPIFVRRIFIWSYYSGLCPVAYYFDDESANYIIQNHSFGIFSIVIIIALIFYIVGNIHISRQEV